MSLYRSEKMGFYTLVMPKESSIDILDSLGTTGYLQFVDPEASEANFRRDYTSYIRRCDELFLKIAVIMRELKKYNKNIKQTENYQEFLSYMSREMKSKNISHLVYFDQIESELEKKLGYLEDQVKKFEEINQKINHLLANRVVLMKTREVFQESRFSMCVIFNYFIILRKEDLFLKKYSDQSLKISETPKNKKRSNMNLEIEMNEIRPFELSNLSLNYLIGIIPKDEILRFKRLIFRVTKGNVYSFIEEIKLDALPIEQRTLNDQRNLSITNKAYFILIYRSGETGALANRLQKVCESFGALR